MRIWDSQIRIRAPSVERLHALDERALVERAARDPG